MCYMMVSVTLDFMLYAFIRQCVCVRIASQRYPKLYICPLLPIPSTLYS